MVINEEKADCGTASNTATTPPEITMTAIPDWRTLARIPPECCRPPALCYSFRLSGEGR